MKISQHISRIKIREENAKIGDNKVLKKFGWEPWSSGYGWRLIPRRLWVWIPALYTGWTFFHIFVIKIVMFVWKDEKEAGCGPFFLKKTS